MKVRPSWTVATVMGDLSLSPQPGLTDSVAWIAMSRAADAYFRRKANRPIVEQIIARFGEMLSKIFLVTFFDSVLAPEKSMQSINARNRLCLFYAEFPDFLIGYLAALRKAALKSQKRPSKLHKAIILLRQGPIHNRRGEELRDKEICAANGWSNALLKKAKQYIQKLDGASPIKLPNSQEK